MDENFEALLTQYKPTEEAVKAVRQTNIVLLVGISGAGKDTIRRILLETGKYCHVASHTTRSPRKNNGVREKDGVEYHFITLKTAKEMLQKSEFIEAKCYSGNIYGTSILELQKAYKKNKIAIADIEVQGVAEYKEMSPSNIAAIFLLPPSYSVWQQRWEKRYMENTNEKSKKLRMETAIAEIEHVLQTSYFSIVINDDLDKTVQSVKKIIKSGMQSDEEYEIGRRVAEEILAAMKFQVSTL